MAESITSYNDLSFHMDSKGLEAVIKNYPILINPYYFSLIKDYNDPVFKQSVPDLLELQTKCISDPFVEDKTDSSFIHRYPDRILIKTSARCAVNCRHCMRKREIGKKEIPLLDDAIDYIKSEKTISEVILSGGDPLMLDTRYLNELLNELDNINHVSTIRIHSRVLCTLPQRITDNLVNVLSGRKSLYIITHFNHPNEITEYSEEACGKLINKGIPLGCQTVLLRGINNNHIVMGELFKELVRIKVKPYYLHHPDPIKGTDHFRVNISEGLEIMKRLRGKLSGLCIPQYMLELPDGGGKIPLLPEYIKKREDGVLKIENYNGEIYYYKEPSN
ncbi:MAG: KamA family radical SAM protein [Desulfobacterales bacterium]|nr:KamA family radical SAM protein [Desulfobacterales bacterium]MCP4158719.1 KamA family radical SAM protein [Deltaproteobacteria bacterium]